MENRLTRGPGLTEPPIGPNGGSFQKGHAKMGGRKKGTPNQITREVVEGIFAGVAASGHDDSAASGLPLSLQTQRQVESNRHRPRSDFFLAPALSARRHEQPRRLVDFQIAHAQLAGLADRTGAGLRHDLAQQANSVECW